MEAFCGRAVRIMCLILMGIVFTITMNNLTKKSTETVHETKLTRQQPIIPQAVQQKSSPDRRLTNPDPGLFLGYGPVPAFFGELSLMEAQALFHGKMMRTQYYCPEIRRFGRKKDGGYDVCVGGEYQFKQNDCLVYSFGIRNDWSFDDDINEQLGCEVHSFDPSIGKEDRMRRPNLYFHKLGIWGEDTTNALGWRLYTLQSIINMLNHQHRTIDYLKLDVEGAEFPSMRAMLDSGAYKQVRQTVIEVHTPRLREKNETMSVNDYGEIYQHFHDLEKVGFQKFTPPTINGCCAVFSDLVSRAVADRTVCCYEQYYVNTNCGAGSS